ncbi:MAG TPA: hypothetical protein DGR97_02550, partial [Gammaproteobacteria bacterium]|nr:hypothetical protein [Gammaproteobacteria bacterium]
KHVNYRWAAVMFVLALSFSGCGLDEPGEPDGTAGEPGVSSGVGVGWSSWGSVDLETLKQGEDVYGRYCAGCHAAGDGHPGTMRLAIRSGTGKSIITARDDLAPDYIKMVVRNGLGMMPAFRPTEIGDGELNALTRYIVAANENSGGEIKK